MTIITNVDFLILVVRAHTFRCHFRQLDDSNFQWQRVSWKCNKSNISLFIFLFEAVESFLCDWLATSNARVFSNVLQDGCPVSVVCEQNFSRLWEPQNFEFNQNIWHRLYWSPWHSTTQVSPRRSNEVGDNTDTVNPR
jgi:hypothetical protein